MSHKIQSATMLDPLKIQAIFLTGEVIQYNLENLFPSLPQFRALQSDPALSSRLTLEDTASPGQMNWISTQKPYGKTVHSSG